MANQQPHRGELTWAIRSSLVRYVTVVSGGTVTVAGGVSVSAAGVFSFPLLKVVHIGEEHALSFSGSVRLLAHHGLLDILIADPELLLTPAGGVVIARTSDEGSLTPLACTPAVPGQTFASKDRSGVWEAVPTVLLEPAVEVFGNVYPAGTELAPLAISVPAGFLGHP